MPVDPTDLCIIGDPDADYYDSMESLAIEDNENENLEIAVTDDLAIPDLNVLEEGDMETAKAVLARNTDTAFEDAMKQQQLDEANAIYERLMNEAAYDEALKQAEIEAAKLGQVL